MNKKQSSTTFQKLQNFNKDLVGDSKEFDVDIEEPQEEQKEIRERKASIDMEIPDIPIIEIQEN